jgi:hypothetical protein
MASSTSSKNKQPLPLADTLRDLALLRASDVDLASVLPDRDGAAKPDMNAQSVQRSYEFVKEARATLRLQNRGDLDHHGDNVERIREGLEEVVKGLEAQ